MSANVIPQVTLQEYLEGELKAEYKSEYYKGQIYAMAGGSTTHGQIAANVIAALVQGLRGTPCSTYTSDVRLRASFEGLYTYPDVMVVCGQVRYADDKSHTITNPTVIIEVLSPSTEAHDRGFKFAQYRKIDSLQEYVLVSQSERRVEKFHRRGEQWVLSECVGIEAVCELESVNCRIQLAEIYDKVAFESA